MYVLDSLAHKCPRRKQIDNHIAHNLEHLFSMLMSPPKDKSNFEVITEDLPQQLNLYKCGIMVLKYLQLWDPMKKYDGKSMFAYTCEDLQQFRQDYICEWVLDLQNIYRGVFHTIQ
ncbi:Ulp1 protease family [Vigna unguiculata]|uniref:Ulp1 protease family n=1 Tax=Vigna unguiculata TaxID=3917 RepID=A0A4D6LM45_VIGUN|nr:Ulp1 protease family [Vigna unguiculata]